ncbi:unnamed protein product [Camellia sinensis]
MASSSSSRRSIDMGRRNRGGPVIVRCTENPQPPIYDKYFCLSTAEFDDSYNIKEWYMLNLSSNNNNEKEKPAGFAVSGGCRQSQVCPVRRGVFKSLGAQELFGSGVGHSRLAWVLVVYRCYRG